MDWWGLGIVAFELLLGFTPSLAYFCYYVMEYARTTKIVNCLLNPVWNEKKKGRIGTNLEHIRNWGPMGIHNHRNHHEPP